MKKFIFIALILWSLCGLSQLSPGDIAIIEYNSDDPDKIAFVALVDISSGTEIKFTDNGWKSDDTWRTGEGTYIWTSPGVSCGDVISITLSGTALSTSGDQIIAYQNTSDFIYAVNADGAATWQADATSSNTSDIPTGLVNGMTAVALTEYDNAMYAGTTTGTKADILAAISDYTNWTYDNTNQLTFSGTFSISDCGAAPPPTADADVQIESILVDACINGSGTEGENEMARFRVDSAAVPLNSLTVEWPNNPWLGLTQNATTASIVSDINATITAGGLLLEPTNDSLPANSIVMLITSTDFDYTAHDWSGLNFTMYAIFQTAGNTAGHFKNYETCGSNCDRTLIINFATYDSDTVTYDYSLLVGDGDGDGVDFDDPGNPTYSNCGCSAPYVDIQTLPVELSYFIVSCDDHYIIFNWITLSETNNDFFVLQKSLNLITWVDIATILGAGNSNSEVNYWYSYYEDHNGDIYFRIKQVDFDGQYEYHNIVYVNCDILVGDINVYPNPVKEGEGINVDGYYKSYIVYDILGRRCDANRLKEGVYVLLIDGQYSIKLIVE